MGGRSTYYDLYGEDEFDDFSRPTSPEMDDPTVPAPAGGPTSLIPDQIEDLGRKVTATASHLFASTTPASSDAYRSAIQGFHKKLKEPKIQRTLFNMATQSSLAGPTLTSRFAISNFLSVGSAPAMSDHELGSIPVGGAGQSYSLFQGFQVSLPDDGRLDRSSRLLTESADDATNSGSGRKQGGPLQQEEAKLKVRLDAIRIRKLMAGAEIGEIDTKLSNLQTMRSATVARLASLEQDELDLETRLMDVQDELETEQPDGNETGTGTDVGGPRTDESDLEIISMSGDSVRMDRPPKPDPTSSGSRERRRRSVKRMSVPILHEHLEPGSMIRQIESGHAGLTALDFDRPFGLMVTAGLDENVYVWDLSLGGRIGSLEGHLSSVKCLQIDDTIVATGSSDATIRLWDLSKADHARGRAGAGTGQDDQDALFAGVNAGSAGIQNSLQGCELLTLEAHVSDVTALHVHADTLVSGSADKTLRQWDLVKGRCVQTLDVIWASAQASGTAVDSWKPVGRAGGFANSAADSSASFVGALQCSNYELVSGTADGVVRTWDLRSGQVSRNLIGHTGPVSGLQFDDYYLVTSSWDKSIRIWDLRTGTILDAFGYEHPITSLMFDHRKIVSAAGEKVVKVYDKAEGIHFDCGPGMKPEGGSDSAVIEHVRIRESYLIEARDDGVVGIWSC